MVSGIFICFREILGDFRRVWSVSAGFRTLNNFVVFVDGFRRLMHYLSELEEIAIIYKY